MLSLSINLMFWSDCLPNSTRERNVYYAVDKLNELNAILKKSIDSEINIIDYSKTQVLKDSRHIPYPDSVYKRSEKINNLLKECDKDLFGVIDADCFIKEDHYEKLRDLILTNGAKSCFTFDTCDFSAEDTAKILFENANPDSLPHSSRFPGRAGGFGGFFIVNAETLRQHNGFDEKFKTWGGEDGEVYDRVFYDNTVKNVSILSNEITVYHLNHFCDSENINYFNRQEYMKNNNLSD